MEESYLGYTIKYNEEKSLFEATNGQHSFENARLRELRGKIDRQVAHDKGFKQFEAWHFTSDDKLRRVRVTSVNREDPRYDGYHPDRKPIYRVRITYLDKVEDEYSQRNEVDYTTIFALDPRTELNIKLLKELIDKRDSLETQIEAAAKEIPRLKLSDIGLDNGK